MKEPTGLSVFETPPISRTSRAWLWATLAALAVRLVVVAFVYQGFLDPGRDHWEFGYETGKIATSIVTGHGFSNPYYGVTTGPTAEIAPVLPYLLAGLMAIFGVYTKATALAMLILNSLFSALTCVPIFFLAKRSFGLPEARWATWAWAFFPYAVYFSADSMWDHALTALLLTWLVLVAVHLEDSNSLGRWAGFGFLSGISALTCPVILGTLPFLGGWVCYRRHRQRRSWVLPAAAAMFVILVTLAPWLIRNYRTFHRPVFLKDGLPVAFLDGNVGNSVHWNDELHDPCGSAAEMAQIQRLGEQAYMAEKWREVFDFVKSNPGIVLRRSVRRFVYMWTGYWSFRPEYLREEPFDPVNIVFCTALTLLALAGLKQSFRTAPDKAIPYALVLMVFPVVYYFTIPERGYRQPLEPEMVILACCAVVSWLRTRQGNERQLPFSEMDMEESLMSRTRAAR
jgi:4-amino-4-deoxy-L-arabinose transferase-like glycosyltransferase